MDFSCVILFLMLIKSVYARLPDVDIVKAVAVPHGKILLSWKPQFQLKKGDLKYIIRYKEDKAQFERVTADKPRIILKDLKSDALYTIAVRATRAKKRGNWSASTTVKTLPTNAVKSDMNIIQGNVTVIDITTSSATVEWSVDIEQDNFKAFRVVWKNKKSKEEEEMTNQNFTLTRLEPDTRYIVNVYLFSKTGTKIKVGNVKFVTREEQIKTPRNFRLKSVTDTTIEVKWRRLDRDDPNNPVTGYVLEYKVRGEMESNMCRLETDKTEKTFKIQGLLPDTKYSLRLAGQFGHGTDHVTGPYSDWLKVKTEPFEDERAKVEVYNIKTAEVLVLWKPAEGYNFRFIQIIDTTFQSYGPVYQQELVNESTPLSATFVYDLTPNTKYQFIISEYKTVVESESQQCPRRQTTYFTSQRVDCENNCNREDSLFSAYLKRGFYDPNTRLLPLPSPKSHVVTWSTFTNTTSNDSYFYVLKILGEPFLSHLSSHFIPTGQNYHVINDLDPDKRYSICLIVFQYGSNSPIFISEHLLIIPSKDLLTAETTLIDETKSWYSVSSIDLYFKTLYVIDSENESLTANVFTIQAIEDFNLTLVSKDFQEDSFDTLNVTLSKDNTSQQLEFLKSVAPTVYPVEDITVEEGNMIDITCTSRGDPYPVVTWLNITSNETIANVNTRLRVYTTLPKYVGSTQTIDNRTFLGVRSFLTIRSILSDSGPYACVSENSAGMDVQNFQIIVLPLPPGPVETLTSMSSTPFSIEVIWEAPIQTPSQQSVCPITGYRLELLDEFNVVLREANSTATKSLFSNLEPNTLYRVQVSAYHDFGEGKHQQTESKTRRIPILGPAQNVSVVTLNSTIVQITWAPPVAVSTNQVRLRKYIIYLRKEGDRKSVERQIERNITEIIFQDLVMEQFYDFRVIAMSEDGQVSYSEWVQGSTYREAYMDETQPPPPPYNVYLRSADGNIIVSWLPPRNDFNIIVRGYAVTVLNNGTKRESMEVGYKESSVMIYEVDMGVIYQISVQAKNKAGLSLDQWAELYIPEKRVTDFPVQNFRGRGVSSTTVQLQWDPPAQGEGTYSHFMLSFSSSEGDRDTKLPEGGILPSSVRSYVVRSLKPFTQYLFTITPYFKRMKGVSTNMTLRTLTDKPSNAPENVVLSSYNSTAVLIQCKPPSTGKNGIVLSYKVSYRTKRTWRNDVIFQAENDESLKSYATGLLPSTEYEFRVRALTVNGSGPWTEWNQIVTRAPDPVIPMVPRELKVISTSDAIMLSWLPPDQDIVHITGYVVGYGKFIPEVYRTSVTMNKNSHVISGLESGSMYIVSVRSFNEYGESAAIFEVISTKSEE